MGSARRAGRERFKRKACFLCGSATPSALSLSHIPDEGFVWYCYYIIPCAFRRLKARVRSWF